MSCERETRGKWAKRRTRVRVSTLLLLQWSELSHLTEKRSVTKMTKAEFTKGKWFQPMLKALNKAIDNRDEGIMIKDPKSLAIHGRITCEWKLPIMLEIIDDKFLSRYSSSQNISPINIAFGIDRQRRQIWKVDKNAVLKRIINISYSSETLKMGNPERANQGTSQWIRDGC